MFRSIAITLALCLAAVVSPSALGETLTFDDLTTGTDCLIFESEQPRLYFSLPNAHYGGFAWNELYLMWGGCESAIGLPNSGYENGVVSGEYVAWKNDMANGVITRDAGFFNFESVYLTAAWKTGMTVTVSGYSGGIAGELTCTGAVTVDTNAPTLLTLPCNGIDTLRFVSSGGVSAGLGGGGDQFAMDNFSFSTVPIPPAVWLFGSALGLMGVMRRKPT